MECDSIPDINAESHIDKTATKSDVAAHKTAQNKINKLQSWPLHSYLLLFRQLMYGLTQKIGRHITILTNDTRE